MAGFTQQQRYWAELVQLKAQACYVNSYQLECEQNDNCLRIFLAVASSSSIATWAIWQKLGMVWGGIIAVSQVINATKRFLPWERRARELSKLGRDVAEILLVAEQKWYAVAEGLLTDEQIHAVIVDLKRRRNDAERQHLAGHPLPVKKKHSEIARERAEEYFRVYYGVGG